MAFEESVAKVSSAEATVFKIKIKKAQLQVNLAAPGWVEWLMILELEKKSIIFEVDLLVPLPGASFTSAN